MTLNKFNLPDVGEGLTEAEIVAWKVKPGDTVAVNDVLCEIETAKSLVELPSPFAGTVTELLVPEGVTIDVGTAIISVSDAVSGDPTPGRRPRSGPPTGPAAVRQASSGRRRHLRWCPGRRSAGGIGSQGGRRQAPPAEGGARRCRVGATPRRSSLSSPTRWPKSSQAARDCGRHWQPVTGPDRRR